MEVITRLMLTASVSLLVGLSLPLQCQCTSCTPDTRWTSYIPTPPPMDFKGISTTGGCSSSSCIGPGFTSLTPSTLGNGERGTTTLNVDAAHAWNNDVNIQFNFPNSVDVSVSGINLYFYNIPSMNIGLPCNTVLSSVSFNIEGNQDLSQDDKQLRNVTLIPTQELTGTEFIIQFTFSDTDKIDWLLLTEVEICTSGGIPIPNTATITFTGDTVNSVSPTTVNSTISLLCSVENEGRFTWSWTLPSGQTVSPTFILDTGRTSVVELSQVTSAVSGDYICHVDYTGLASDPGLSTMFTVALSLTGMLERENNVVYVDENDIIATLRCELHGYLSPGEPSIDWFKGSTLLTNDSTYTITIETGDGYIQNGGSQTRPSLRSVLNITLMNNPVTADQTFFCQFDQIAGVQAITLSSTSPPITTTPTMTVSTSTDVTISPPPIMDSSFTELIAAIVGTILILIIITTVVIAIVVVCILKKRKMYRINTHGYDDYDTKDPLYQEVPKPLPPPLPDYFPSLSTSIDPYAVVDNRMIGEHLQLVNMNGNRHSVSSVPDPNVPTPARLKNQPSFLENNPLYASTDHLTSNPNAPRLPYRQVLGSTGSMDGLSSSAHSSILNIYAQPFKVAPPVPNRPPTPQLLDEAVYSEAISPTMLTGETTSPSDSVEVCPYSSIYADPKPLLKSEGPKEVEPHQLREIRGLGVGQFGQVVLAETVGLSLKDLKLSDNNDDKNITILVAVKKLKPDADEGIKEAFEKEIKFMSRLNDDNVVRLLGVCTFDNAFIVMEYMENGDLNQYLTKYAEDARNGGTRLSPFVLLFMCVQIASGMMYLATLKFIHRDLATRNCLVGSNNEVKIADFGMSRSLYSSYYYRIRGRAMLPIRWMANECFYGRFTEKTDIWAFGVTMWEVFTFGLKQPYDRMSDQEVIDDAIKGADRQLLEKPDNCPRKVYEVMLRCWVDDTDRRAKFEDVHTLLAALYENNDLS